MANLSTLTVSLVAETGKFENGLKKARKSSAGFGKAVGAGMKAAAIATALFGGALATLVASSLKLVDQQRKTARTLGTSQATFAGLSLAAGIAGSSVESFTKALKRQAKSIVDASDGLQTQKRAFDRLGLSTKDLISLPIEAQFKAITTALGKVENSTLKVAIASDIFGAKNADLINIIDLGADGLDHFIQKVKDLGVALTDKQTKAIEDSNDAVLIMKTAFQGLGNQIAARLAPAIKAGAERIAAMTERVTKSIPKWSAWAASILGVERAIESLTLADLSAEIKQSNSDLDTAIGKFKETERFLDQFNEEQRAQQAGYVTLLEQQRLEVERLTARWNELIKARKELRETGEVAEVGGTGGGELGGGGTFKAEKRGEFGVNRTFEEIARFKAIRDELEANFAMFDQWEAEAQAAFDSTREPLESLMLRLAQLRENPFIDADLQNRSIVEAVEKYKSALEKMKKETDETTKEISEFQREAFGNMQNILSEFLFDPWEQGLDGMLKSFIEMLRKMIAQLIATKILDYFFGLFGSSSPIGSGSGSTPTPVPRRHGGPVGRGGSFLVGEGGPELFSPGATGSVQPLGTLNFTSTTNISGGPNPLTIATLLPILDESNKKLKGELFDAFDRGSFA